MARDRYCRRGPDRSGPYSRPWKESGRHRDRQARTRRRARQREKSRFRGSSHRRFHPIWFFASGYPNGKSNAVIYRTVAPDTLDISQDRPVAGRTIGIAPYFAGAERATSEFERKFGRRSSRSSHADIGAAFHRQPAPGFHLGRLHLKFPDRRRNEGRRPRTEHLGRLLSKRRDQEPRHRRCRVRPLPSLPGGCRPDEDGWAFRRIGSRLPGRAYCRRGEDPPTNRASHSTTG